MPCTRPPNTPCLPATAGSFTFRSEIRCPRQQQLAVIDAVEELLDVDLDHVSVAASAREADRFQRLGGVLLRPEPVELSLKSASKIGSMTSFVACCTTRSRTVGIPSGRFVPSGFGMYCRLTGCGQYRPVWRRRCTSRRKSSTPPCSIIDRLSPSMPAAPRFVLTRFHASARTSPPADPVVERMKASLPAPLGCHVQPALEFSDFVRRVVGLLTHALRPYPLTPASTKAGPLAPAASPAFLATMGPSDSLSARRDSASCFSRRLRST